MGHISQPQNQFNIVPERGITAELDAHRVLIVGRMLTGTATADELYTDVPSSASDINALFGEKSHIAGMLRDFRDVNKVSRLDAYPFAEGGTKATSTLTFTGGPSTADATIQVTVGSAYKYSASVDIASGSTITQAATAVKDAMNLIIGSAPFSVDSTAGVVTFTASNGGTIPNANWDIKVHGVIPGITIDPVAAWSGGTTDPTTPGTTVSAAISGIRYQTIVWPVSYTATNIVAEMDDRFNVDNGVMDGVMVQTTVDTLANAKAYADDFNSQSFAIVWNQAITATLHKGGAVIEMPDIISAKVAALRALRLTTDANLTPYLTTVAPSDQFGGVGIASLPYFNTVLPEITPASPAEFPAFEDIDEATSNALSVIGPNSSFTETIFGEMATTYLKDTTGAADTSYKFLNTVDTISAIREFVTVNCGRRYGQSRLTAGVLVPGKDMANESSIRAFLNELYDRLADLTLVQFGSDAKRDFNTNLTVNVDVGAQKATVSMAPLLVTQLRAIIGTIAINFGG